MGIEHEATTRAAAPADREFLQLVYTSTRSDELAPVPWSDEEKCAFIAQQFNAQDAHYRAHYPTARFLIVEVGGKSAGRLYVDRWPREIRIMDIALLPQYRGRGIGTRLLRDLQLEARATGKTLSIHVEKFNRALQLYSRLGFRVVRDRDVYWFMEWRGDAPPPDLKAGSPD